MPALEVSKRPPLIRALVALAGAAALTPAGLAQDCAVSVYASPQVVYQGQRASVNAYASALAIDPNNPNTPYAIASASFNIMATQPRWTHATSGRILGNNVLGINFSQAHNPQQNIFADPSNPLRVWSGTFSPQSREPALVEIKASPTAFSVYPSRWTSSSVLCEARGGSEYLFVNPLSVGRWLAAPGPGTEARIQDDVVIDGRVITGENWNSATVGLIPTGTVQFFDTSTRVEFDGQPVIFTATVQGVSPQRTRVTSLTVTFDGQTTGGSGHAMGAQFCFGDGSVRGVRYDGFLGGVYVASGDMNNDSNENVPELVVTSLPDTIGAHAGSGAGTVHLPPANTYLGTTIVVGFDRPVVVIARDADGNPQSLVVDSIEVHGVQEAARRAQHTNNLKQLGLGLHSYEAHGVGAMQITPSQGD